jgi:hypothetical protein
MLARRDLMLNNGSAPYMCRHYGERAGCRKIFLAFRQGEVFST